MTQHIIYIHGFASSGESSKTQEIRKRFPDVTVHAPTFVFNPAETMESLSDMIREIADTDLTHIILVGTSLGGFYARILSTRFDVPAILLNPLVHPAQSNTVKVGTYTSYATGKLFEVSQEHLDALSELDTETGQPDMVNMNVFVNRDDDVIDATETHDIFKHAATNTIYPTGGHRFSKMDKIFPTIATLLGE